ncbi:arylamine N-acetyltransferase family protein [Labrys monachus]|uniref:N-hydroxyarylamine O-acetyltransferase n=1 Tax=Labrys monachus TaxID=217067 RepID=A0ABU0F6S9_9HYPH|nr:arylamine N-acetyltransferase [Labrys monachus]MDQ0390327.1 N-hydroxyarylamine O-acetyltransferase [Labrys monachus]
MVASADATVDLDRYCERILYSGPLRPTHATLSDLIEHHVAAIPFENIDVLLGRGVDISAGAVDAKLIGGRRGGYCFEHNGLFRRVLATIGFRVEPLAARVVWMAPADAPPLPRTHMALRVALEEPWLVDAGFGGCVPTSPLRLADPAPQQTRHEAFRITPQGREALVEAELDGIWQPLYVLSPDALLDVDYEPPNWFTATHPASIFRRELMGAHTSREARWTLRNGRLTVRHRDGRVERRQLDAEGLETVLAGPFGLPVEAEWRPLLHRIAATDTPR